MTTLAIALTTSLKDLSTLGRGRQICWSGCSPDFRAQVFVSDSTSGTTFVLVATPAGPSGVIPLPADASVAGKYVLVTGSKTSIWIQGDDAGALLIDLTTAFQDVSSLSEGREVFLGGAPDGLVVAIEIGATTGASTFTEIARLNSKMQAYQLPNDSSVAMRYRVASGGSVGPNTRVWVCAAEAGGGGESDARSFLTIAALEAAPGPSVVSSAVVDQVGATYLFDPGATDTVDHLSVLSAAAGTPGRWLLQGDTVYLSPGGGSDDWPTIVPLMVLAAAAGIRVYFNKGAWKCATAPGQSSLAYWPSNSLAVWDPDATLVSTLTPTGGAGGFAQTPFTSVATTGATTTTSGSRARGVSIVTAVGHTIAANSYIQIAYATNVARTYYVLSKVASGANDDLTLLQPLEFTTGAGLTITPTVPPQNIVIDCNWADMSGTGDRLFEWGGAVNVTMKNVRITTAGGSFTAFLGSFDIACRDCLLDGANGDAGGVTITGFGAESSSDVLLNNVHVQRAGTSALQPAIYFADSTACNLTNFWGMNNQVDVSLATGSNSSGFGCQRCKVEGAESRSSKGTYAFEIDDGDGNTYNNISAINPAGYGLSVGTNLATPTNVTIDNLYVIGAGTSGLRTRSMTGVIGTATFNACVVGWSTEGTCVIGAAVIRAFNCTTSAISTTDSAEISISRAELVATQAGSVTLVVTDGTNSTQYLHFGAIVATLGGAGGTKNVVDITGTFGAFVTIDSGHAFNSTSGGATTVGVDASHSNAGDGPHVLYGSCVDFSALGTNVKTASNSQVNFGTVVSDGTGNPQNIVAECRTGSIVALSRVVNGGTPGLLPRVVAGNYGFAFTGTATDTSTYAYKVVNQ